MSFEFESLELDSEDYLVKNASYLKSRNSTFNAGISWAIDRDRDIFFRTIKTARGSSRRIHAMNRNGVELLFASFYVEGKASITGIRSEALAVFYDIPEEFESIIDEIKLDFIDAYKASIWDGMYSRSQRYDDFTLIITQFDKCQVSLWMG